MAGLVVQEFQGVLGRKAPQACQDFLELKESREMQEEVVIQVCQEKMVFQDLREALVKVDALVFQV